METESKTPVVLWRGTTLETTKEMLGSGSARGDTLNVGVSAPSEEEGKVQADHGGFLPEFTTDINVAGSFSRGSALVVVSIAAKYLVKAGVTEGGRVPYHSAHRALFGGPDAGCPGNEHAERVLGWVADPALAALRPPTLIDHAWCGRAGRGGPRWRASIRHRLRAYIRERVLRETHLR